jgi:hypothetical protein
VEVEMLDYGFIEGCSDVKLLHDIVSVLKSGKEGYYPDVINPHHHRSPSNASKKFVLT